jgi:UDP-2,4-diacetamido-2,4,6-trideoxy-beta-L-altropyranose hydrolase
MTSVIFRTDANSALGFGHLTRCRVLAQSLKARGAQCFMVGPAVKYQGINDKDIFQGWYPHAYWESETSDCEKFVALAKQFGCSIAILDDYRIRLDYQKVLLESKIKWLQFDGRADIALWANWILNANPIAKKEHYTNLLMGHGQELLLGPSYAILRPEFQKKVKKSPFNIHSIRIFITFGGGDDKGAIIFTLSALYDLLPQATFVVMSGDNNPRNNEINNWVNIHRKQRIEIHINPAKVQPLMEGCDLAVMSGGSSTFEALASGLPMIIMSIAENQIKQAQAWHKLKVGNYIGHYEGCSEDSLQKVVLSVLEKYKDISKKIRMISINTNGCAEITKRILQNYN